MDNMDNSNQQNNDLNNAYASYRREKNKNKSKFGKGLVAGILVYSVYHRGDLLHDPVRGGVYHDLFMAGV